MSGRRDLKVVRSRRVVLPDGVRPAAVHLADGRIAASGGGAPGAPRPGGLQPAPGGPPTPSQPGDTGKKP